MTTSEFKKLYPQWANLEGDALWNQMEAVMLANAHTPTEDEVKKFWEVPENNDPPLESYRFFFIDTSDYEHGKRQG